MYSVVRGAILSLKGDYKGTMMKTIITVCDILASVTLIGMLLIAIPVFFIGIIPGIVVTGICSCLVIFFGSISQVYAAALPMTRLGSAPGTTPTPIQHLSKSEI